MRRLLDGIDQSEDYELFHAELLREMGRFEESKQILINHKVEDDQWVVDAMLRHIEKEDAEPFLLVENGNISNAIRIFSKQNLYYYNCFANFAT